MAPYLVAALSAAHGSTVSADYAVVVALIGMLVLVILTGVGVSRRRAHSAARRHNPPSEPDGSKAQPPAQHGRGEGDGQTGRGRRA